MLRNCERDVVLWPRTEESPLYESVLLMLCYGIVCCVILVIDCICLFVADWAELCTGWRWRDDNNMIKLRLVRDSCCWCCVVYQCCINVDHHRWYRWSDLNHSSYNQFILQSPSLSYHIILHILTQLLFNTGGEYGYWVNQYLYSHHHRLRSHSSLVGSVSEWLVLVLWLNHWLVAISWYRWG
jgi:hypothetical protein